jgi:hypothetical protein
MVLVTYLSGLNAEKLPLFVAKLARGRHDSTIFNEKLFFKNLGIPLHSEARYFTAVHLKDPRPMPPGSGEPK